MSSGRPSTRSSISIENDASPALVFSTEISIRNGWLANTSGAGRRVTARPRMVSSDSTPEAMMNDRSHAKSRYSRLLPVLMAARPMASARNTNQ
ncbi:MAG: hypothetical protein R3B06_12995 [Kofleriaceae bacterium]